MANPTATLAKPLATAVVAFTFAAFSVYIWKRKSRVLEAKIRELESFLASESAKCAAERQGRIRAQQVIKKLQDLRKTLAQPNEDNADEMTAYPMTPIGIVHSCFSTRNGTPRQPLVVPLARASLVFNTSRVPPAALEGIESYSHCWIIYVFHLNTNLQKLWQDPTKSKFKAKVRVPRLKGDKMGVFSTRSPHRPCPIGLTVAKVESVKGNTILLSGVDLVDGTPVLDIKPYLPYCDSIQGASVPPWVAGENLLAVASISFSDGFDSSLGDCWEKSGKNSLYASPNEFQNLIKQVLSWDIRSLSQRIRPHEHLAMDDDERPDSLSDSEDQRNNEHSVSNGDILYHVILEGLKVSYRIDGDGNVVVEKISQSSTITSGRGTTLITQHGEADQGDLS